MFRIKNWVCIVVIFVSLAVIFGGLIWIYFLKNARTEFPSDPNNSVESETVGDNNHVEYRIESTNEEGEWVVVKTTYGSFKYPFAFSDLIVIEAADLERSAQLRFFMKMDDNNVPIYTIHYNSGEGSLCGTLKLSDGAESIPVTVVLADKPEDLSEDWRLTFYATQETFNDVLFSMAEDKNFSIAE